MPKAPSLKAKKFIRSGYRLSLVENYICKEGYTMKKYVAAVSHRGIGNELVTINAHSHDAAFNTLFSYYIDKGERLGNWLDGNGEDAGDYNYTDGIFESSAEWDWFITESSNINTIGGENLHEKIFCGLTIDNVMSVYPALTEVEAYGVLCYVDKHQGFECGVAWFSIENAVSAFYPEKLKSNVNE